MFKRLLLVLFLLFSLPGQIVAQTEFATDYTVNYTVKTNGLTHAKLNISLTNQLSNIYAQEFTLSIGSTKLANIAVFNDSGTLEPNIVQGDKTTNITVIFPEKILGKDKAQLFTLEFTTSDFSRRLVGQTRGNDHNLRGPGFPVR